MEEEEEREGEREGNEQEEETHSGLKLTASVDKAGEELTSDTLDDSFHLPFDSMLVPLSCCGGGCCCSVIPTNVAVDSCCLSSCL